MNSGVRQLAGSPRRPGSSYGSACAQPGRATAAAAATTTGTSSFDPARFIVFEFLRRAIRFLLDFQFILPANMDHRFSPFYLLAAQLRRLALFARMPGHATTGLVAAAARSGAARAHGQWFTAPNRHRRSAYSFTEKRLNGR
ncbi:hypothetical protein [Burkholderia savannae]|uniref:hypothetical protein n=1 Tax=Burkholderia savannae TaxID=1637837 RepID=UPI001E611DE2|nr:hypothetical protein [Burkholderia savannae]